MMPTINYPDTKGVNVIEEHFEQAIADPYRWLENHVRNNEEVAAWVESQNKGSGFFYSRYPEPKQGNGSQANVANHAVYRYDVASNTAWVWAQPRVAIDLSQIAVEQRFYTSKDSTRVPMFIGDGRRENGLGCISFPFPLTFGTEIDS